MHSATSAPVVEGPSESSSPPPPPPPQLSGDSLEATTAGRKEEGPKRQQTARHQFVRRWSAPAKSRASKLGIISKGGYQSRHSSLRNKSQNDLSATSDHQHRNYSEAHKSTGSLRPTSSSASDSAFSQSQTTLGPVSETSNRFSFLDRSKSNSDNERLSTDGNGSTIVPAEEDCAGQYSREHFKIIWQNLSYKIPEKRFSRLISFALKLKDKWASAANEKCTEQGELSLQADFVNANIGVSQRSAYVGHKCAGERRFHALDQCGRHSNANHLPRADELEDGLRESTASSGNLAFSKQRKIIFSNLNGCVKSGQLTAILGPSGAGKTTFLKCLTNSITKGVSGSILIHNGLSGNSVPSSNSSQHLKLCIIPQKDYLFDNLTVMENLLFASHIKNTRANFNHKENVYRVANLLGLQMCLKLKTSRLSGGQYKRVSIAQELLSQPDILILDEPTSGLDSLTCFKTVSVLSDLANMSQAGLLSPLAIVMTIHQPQIKIFNLFNHVYILSALGQCVYEGKPDHLVHTVAERCKLLPPPDDRNPASFIIDLASEVYGSKPVEQLIELQYENFLLVNANGCNSGSSATEGNANNHGQQRADNLAKSVEGKQIGQLVVANLTTFEAPKMGPSFEDQFVSLSEVGACQKGLALDSSSSTSRADQLYISDQLKKRYNHEHNFWLHTGLLIKRLWISMWRDSLLTTTRVTFHLIIPFVFYFVYSQKSGLANACPHVERELDIQDMVSDSNIERLTIQHDELILTFENVSLFFLLLYSFSMCVLAVTALSFPLNMQILLKETTNGWYTMPRFVMAKTLADLPIELTMPMISVSIAYSLTGQPSSYLCWRMISVTAVMTLCSLISQTQGLLFGAYFMNNVQAAVFISQASTLPWIMLSGFTTRVSQLPKVLQWLSFGSIYRLGIESIVAVRYGFGMCPCDRELVNDTPPKIVGIPDQLKSVISYYLDMYSETTTMPTASHHQISGSGQTSSSLPSPANIVNSVIATPTHSNHSNNGGGDIFTRIASTLVRANTYGADIVSCEDVKPFIMSAREVDESTLPIFLSILLSVLLALKVLLFYVVRIKTR